MTHEVAIVVDPLYGEKLEQLSSRMHTWVVQSTANNVIRERLWLASKESSNGSGGYSLDAGVSSVSTSGGEAAEALFVRMLDLVESHHGYYSHDPPWTVLHCFGLLATDTVRQALADYGVDDIREEHEHFVAMRPLDAAIQD